MNGKKYWIAGLVIWLGVIWFLSNQPHLSSGLEYDFLLRKIAHVTEFGILYFLFLKALGGKNILLAVLLSLGYAIMDEWHQSWVLGRFGNVRDVAIDLIGILLCAVILFWQNRKTISF